LRGRIGGWRRIRQAPNVWLLPKGNLVIDELGGATRVPDPLSPQYGKLAAMILGQRIRQRSHRALLRLLPAIVRRRRSWQARLQSRSHTLAREMLLEHREESH
jgi:hypothetical protein